MSAGATSLGHAAPTIEDLILDRITQIGLEHWASQESDRSKLKPFNDKIVQQIYSQELQGSAALVQNRIAVLEISQYLENYLIPNFDAAKSSFEHLMSILMMCNEKFSENVDAWGSFDANKFPSFFERVLQLRQNKLSLAEQSIVLVFLANAFRSLENEMVRKECFKLASILIWLSIHEERRAKEFREVPPLEKLWKKSMAKYSKASEAEKKHPYYLAELVNDYIGVLNTITKENADSMEEAIVYCERCLQFFIDLVSQLTTRRFCHLLLTDLHVLVKSRMAPLSRLPEGSLFSKLLNNFEFYIRFEVNNYTGEEVSEVEKEKIHYARVKDLQRVLFTQFDSELRPLALAPVSAIDNENALKKFFGSLSIEQLRKLFQHLSMTFKDTDSKETLVAALVATFERTESQISAINRAPLFPDERLLWDPDRVPDSHSKSSLALPRLNVQFLTFHDYFLRNLTLYTLESAYEIREDIEDAVRRLKAKIHRTEKGDVVSFEGWSRFAASISSVRVDRVVPPKVGYSTPASVSCTVNYTIPQPVRGQQNDVIVAEWDQLRLDEPVFLIHVRPALQDVRFPTVTEADPTFPKQYGVISVRGGSVKDLLDENNKSLLQQKRSERAQKKSKSASRVLKLELDPAQYLIDLNEEHPSASVFAEHKTPTLYSRFNVILRRKPLENNFKSVLETIRDLINVDVKIPEWLHDVFLGYGDPSQAESTKVINDLDFRDTFVSRDHLKESFPHHQIQFSGPKSPCDRPWFRLDFDDGKKTIKVTESVPARRDMFDDEEVKLNPIKFTPVQVQAIRKSLNEGLVMVVGPPGTGKTDLAVQTIANWYHNFPHQRTLIITHSNQALNHIFEKIARLDIDPKHLVRLGHGYSQIKTEVDFSKSGRVDYLLRQRLILLAQVERLAASFGHPSTVAYSCETSENYFKSKIMSLWERFELELSEIEVADDRLDFIQSYFPFKAYFDESKAFAWTGNLKTDLDLAKKGWQSIVELFQGLRDCRPLELFKVPRDRANYVLMNQARIVAMTCTHAAIKRKELLALGFKFDNVIMEEAAQVLEIETLIPLLLQKQSASEAPRLKRVVLIGDHHQLPPVVQNQSIQRQGRLDQSLFTRFIRLGVPHIVLDRQGRSRPSLAALYRWRYPNLGDLPHIEQSPDFHTANAGFRYEAQIINVDDFRGRGESSPTPYFYQNLGEAEYVVAVYMYMRMLGYPAEKISILTTYNGQKQLLRDVIDRRCASNPAYGKPKKITTVDRYQGQQNDYILLSLVRTKSVGHLRDIRRLIVAMSRSRLGLYIFCRKKLFANCYELTPVFSQLLNRPDHLSLVQNEEYPTSRELSKKVDSQEVRDLEHMAKIVGIDLQ